jgi:hypothetical protein
MLLKQTDESDEIDRAKQERTALEANRAPMVPA